MNRTAATLASHFINSGSFAILLVLGWVFVGCVDPEAKPAADEREPAVTARTPVEAGRYLVVVGGCNDCHTAGYLETEGDVPEEDWLTGSAVGWRGPWGTTYPANLRLTAQNMSEDDWVEMLHTRTTMPPMPWMNVNQISDQDARAIYRYIESLGAKGGPVPGAVPPDQEPSTPYVDIMPQNLPETE